MVMLHGFIDIAVQSGYQMPPLHVLLLLKLTIVAMCCWQVERQQREAAKQRGE